MKNQYKNSHGFTLIEVLIAIVLLAFISLYTYKMIDTNIDTKEQVLKEDRLLLQTLTAIARIDSDFSQTYSPLYSYSKNNPTADPDAIYQDNATSNGLFDGKAKNGIIIPQFQSEDKSTLVFFTSSNRRKIAGTKESRYNWVKYSLRTTDKSKEEDFDKKLNATGIYELVRQTIASNIYNSELNWTDIKPQVLLTQIKSLEYSFWDEQKKKFSGSILELNEYKNIIRALKIKLIWIDEDNHEQKIEKIFRVSFPFFNTKTDDLKISTADNPSGGTPQVSNPDQAGTDE